MSQDELAEKLEVTRQSISLWETGQTQPSLDNIIALAKIFNVTTDVLLKNDTSDTTESEVINVTSNKSKNKTYILIVCIVVVLLIGLILWKIGVFDSSSSSKTNSADDDNVSVSAVVDNSSENGNKSDKDAESSDNKKAESASKYSKKEENTKKTQTPVRKEELFEYLKNFVIQKGTINGDYCYYSKTSDNYGGNASEDFSLYYWGDTDKIEFCLHRVINDTFSINFYLYVPKVDTSEYKYITSYYYRDSGEPLYEAEGTITADEFTKNYPLYCTEYLGSSDEQDEFMETSRQGICLLLDCLKEFTEVENLKYSFGNFGFSNF